MTLIAQLRKRDHGEGLQDGGPRAVDIALADTLQRLDPHTDPLVLAATALASLAVSAGDAAFDPARPPSLPDAINLPDAASWTAALQASSWVDQPQADAVADPGKLLVLENGLLYLRRYREYERRLAAGLQRLAAQTSHTTDIAALTPLFATLFPRAADDDAQAHAAALALIHPLLLVTGGPGTGKTTTIARLLLLLLAQARHNAAVAPRIALAAPTGRAADRMADSVAKTAAALRETAGVDAALCDALPTRAQTLHRLLGTIPRSPRFRHGADNPLPYDVIVVDEASMVDLPMMCKLVDAIGEGARLVLIGDPGQLPSVEAGDVLAAIVEAAGEDVPLPDELAPLFGANNTPVGAAEAASSLAEENTRKANSSRLKPLLQKRKSSSGGGLRGHRVHLTRGYRQSDALDLAPLATAVRDGDADRAVDLLRGNTLAGVHFHEDLSDPLTGNTRETLLASWQAITTADDAQAALALAARVRLLTALRDGPQGAHALNARIEEALAGAQRTPYFHGRLLLVTENSYRNNLFNGDIGVCLRDDDGATSVCFSDGNQGVRRFHPAALPAHTGAFATTVHKAQGSEFSSTWLLLPQHDARPLSRELLYTAMTRSREVLHICASEGILRSTLARNVQRISGLFRRLNTQVGTTQG